MTATAGQKRVPNDFISGNPFPLPPLAEQHRIVAKVDELMALCDQLEQQQEDSLRTHDTLVATLLGALPAASERGQFAQAWQRIEANFDPLFTTQTSTK
ncbi:MAG: restriction endonuclease subunit S, partial [Candidatus Hydrogenedentes bacterium]|nr:restriction endonuclease subunit S [Candidatus Hydrogenedentota bacterium]